MSEQASRTNILLVALAMIYIVLILAPISYSPRLWGITQLTYFDWGTRATVAVVALLVPTLLFTVVDHLRLKKLLRILIIYVAVPALLLATFYILRMKTHYLGDGILRMRQIEHNVWILPTEPLGVTSNFLAYKLTRSLFGFSALQAMEAVSYLGGVLFYYAALFLTGVLFNRSSDRFLGFFLIFFSGTAVLFCAYLETYSLLPAGIALFAGLGIRALEANKFAVGAIVVYLVLVLFHFANLLLAPCLLLLAFIYFRGRKASWSLATLGAIMLSVLFVLFVPKLSPESAPGVGHLLIPLLPGADPYWLLSGQHLLDILDELLLTAVPVLILLPVFLTSKIRRETLGERRVLFTLAAIPGALMFITLLDPKLGYASDWDLFASAGLVLTIAATALLSKSPRLASGRGERVALAATCLLAFLSYAAVNSSYDRSIDRQVDVLSIAGERGGIGFESMGNYLNYQGDTQMAERMWRRAANVMPHKRTYSNLGQLLVNQKRFKEAEYFLNEGLKLDSNYAPLYLILGKVYTETGRFEKADSAFKRALKLDPGQAAFYYNYAFYLMRRDRYAEAEKEAREAVRLNPKNASYVCGLGVCLAAQRKFNEASECFVEAARLSPGLPQAYIGMARLLDVEGRRDEARTLVQEYLKNYPHSPSRGIFEDLLSEFSEKPGVQQRKSDNSSE
jgi:Flp pilus assembly protein TadD